jgi:hypothetical protein
LISDADGSIIDELPLQVVSGYDPARLVLDVNQGPGANGSSTGFSYALMSGSTVLSADTLNDETSPIAVGPGSYTLHAARTGGDTTGCDESITVSAGADLAYTASSTGSKCSWGASPTTGF